MSVPIIQHQEEIKKNLEAWTRKPLLQQLYRGFYQKILELVDPALPGRIVEIGSGIGNLKNHLPRGLATDIFPNPWLDLVCDAYALPFADRTLSHLILFDVFHHLRWPARMLAEAARVLVTRGRILIFEPYISAASSPAYGLFHHEPVAWHDKIETIVPNQATLATAGYYAAQGNATRLFFRDAEPGLLEGWDVFHREAFAAFGYLLSGGFSKQAFYPPGWLPILQTLDRRLSKWPRLFGGRCLIGLRRR